MGPEQYQRIKDLFQEASELQGAERERLLAAASPEDRKQVQAMLQGATMTFLREPFGHAAPAVKPPGLKPGEAFGRYEIQSEIGAGGGGRVYLALDTSLQRKVAIKTLTPGSMNQERRFMREAETASALNHPNIVTVYEAGVESGVPFIAMEYISGRSLRDNLPKNKALPLEKFFPWALQICDALATAHQAGLVHRDLKPGNIMITERGAAKIVDFGLAKPMAMSEQGEDSLTGTGMVLGTAGYMAPEQAEGHEVDARADIFALGCILHEMASGQRAFPGHSALEKLAATVNKEPELLRQLSPTLPAGLEQIIWLCLRKKPEERLQSAGDIKLMLQQIQQQPPAAPPENVSPGRGWGKAVAALVLGSVLTAGAYWFWQKSTNKTAPTPVTTMLTTDDGLAQHPAISQDGKLVAYASDRGGEGNLDIWLQQIGGGAPVRLTNWPEDESTPDFSPDGAKVVFRSEHDAGGIYVVPVIGSGQPVLLAQGARNPKFSPDGQWVAYWVGQESERMFAGSAAVYAVPAGGGQTVNVSANMAAAMYPVWSPDGRAILATARKEADIKLEKYSDWWVIPFRAEGAPVNTHTVDRLEENRPKLHSPPIWQSQQTAIQWGADGQVLFASTVGDTTTLWRIGVDPNTKQPTGPAVPVTNGTGHEVQGAPALFDQARRLVFAGLSLHFDLWSIPVEQGLATVRGEMAQLTHDASREFYPSISADGSKLAYTTFRANADVLCLRQLPSGVETTLLTGVTVAPRISGDGKWVVFTDRQQQSVSRISTRGGATEKLCSRCGTPTHVDFTGSQVLLEPLDAPEAVMLLDVAAGKTRVAVPARERLFSAKFSPDHKWVVFVAVRPGSAHAQVFVANIEAGEPAKPESWIAITDADTSNQNPSWAADGSAVYFLSDRDGFRCVWSRRLDPVTKKPSSAITEVRHFHSARRSLQAIRRLDARTELAISGQRVIVVLGDLTGNIWLRQ